MTPICLLTLLLASISAATPLRRYGSVAEMQAAFTACRLDPVRAQGLLEELEAAARAELTPPPEQLRSAIADAVAGQSGFPERLAAAARFFELSPESVRATCRIRAVSARGEARALSVVHTGASVLSPGGLSDVPPMPLRIPAQAPKPPVPTSEQPALRQHLSDLKLTVPPFHRSLPPAALAERSLNTALESFTAKHGRLPNDAEFQELYERAFGAEGSPLRAALDVALREEFHAGQKQALQIGTIVGIPGIACALIAEGYVTGWTKTAAWVDCALPPVFWTARAAGLSPGRIMGAAARGVEWIMERGKSFTPVAGRQQVRGVARLAQKASHGGGDVVEEGLRIDARAREALRLAPLPALRRVRLGRLIARGTQGQVFHTPDLPGKVIKLFKNIPEERLPVVAAIINQLADEGVKVARVELVRTSDGRMAFLLDYFGDGWVILNKYRDYWTSGMKTFRAADNEAITVLNAVDEKTAKLLGKGVADWRGSWGPLSSPDYAANFFINLRSGELICVDCIVIW